MPCISTTSLWNAACVGRQPISFLRFSLQHHRLVASLPTFPLDALTFALSPTPPTSLRSCTLALWMGQDDFLPPVCRPPCTPPHPVHGRSELGSTDRIGGTLPLPLPLPMRRYHYPFPSRKVRVPLTHLPYLRPRSTHNLGPKLSLRDARKIGASVHRNHWLCVSISLLLKKSWLTNHTGPRKACPGPVAPPFRLQTRGETREKQTLQHRSDLFETTLPHHCYYLATTTALSFSPLTCPCSIIFAATRLITNKLPQPVVNVLQACSGILGNAVGLVSHTSNPVDLLTEPYYCRRVPFPPVNAVLTGFDVLLTVRPLDLQSVPDYGLSNASPAKPTQTKPGQGCLVSS